MCRIRHLNLDIPGIEEGLLLLSVYEEIRSNLGKIQGPASAEIWPRAPISRFPISSLKGGSRKAIFGESCYILDYVLLRKPGEFHEGGEDF